MQHPSNSVLLIGESAAGKTHYGAQLLGRLMSGTGELRMEGQADNLAPYETALACLNQGMAAKHTSASIYVDSTWPVIDADGNQSELIWPDYGGEQIKEMSTTRRIPVAWRSRTLAAPAWLLLIRLQNTKVVDDIFSRPLQVSSAVDSDERELVISDQARLVELMQMLLHARGALERNRLCSPNLCILLSCWDELGTSEAPAAVLQERLPMFASFVRNVWKDATILGLSALERPLRPDSRDAEYAEKGPGHYGYVVLENGERISDLTYPIKLLLTQNAARTN